MSSYPRSKLEGNVAEVSVLLALGLSPESFQLSVRNADRTAEPRRRILAGHEFEWTDVIDHRRGVISFEVQRGSIVECRALYGGCCHDTREIADVSILPNERRMIVELNDPGLARMLEVVTTIRERDDKLRNEFESIVAVLLYMLGFEAVRIGGTRKLTDGPDIYASTPAGELLVIECTSGAFSEEKLGKLMARTKDARAKLDQLPDGQNGFNVTAAMVTPRTREELGDTLAKAEKQGVLVLCGPELLAGFDRTRFYPNADQILKEWRQGALLRFLANPTRE